MKDKSAIDNIDLDQVVSDKLKIQNRLLNDELVLKSLILDSATDSIFLHDFDGNFIYINKTAYKSRGYTKDELMGMNLHDLDTQEYAELIKPRIKELMEKGEITFESGHFRKDMSIMPVEVHARIIESEGKNCVLSIARDISERKKAEETLKKAYDDLEMRVDGRTADLSKANKILEQEIDEHKNSEERFKIIFEYAPDGYYLNDMKANIVDANKAAERLTGYKKEEVIGKNLLQLKLLPLKEVPRVSAILAKNTVGLSTGPDEFILNRKDGSKIVVESMTFPVKIGGQKLVLGSIRDITKRINAENALKESEIYYRTIFETTGTATVLIEEDTTISLANSGFEKLSGYSRKEIEGKKSWTEFVLREDRAKMKEQHHLRRDNPKSALNNYEFRFIDKKGDIKDIFLTVGMIPNTKMSVASLMDITDKKRSRIALRESEQKFRSIVEQSYNGVTLSDEEGKIIEWNNAQERITGFKRNEVIGKYLWDMSFNMAPKISRTSSAYERLKTSTLNILKTGKAPGPNQAMEHEIVRPDGTKAFIETLIFTIKTDKGFMGCSIVSDITERKKAEKALKASEESLRRTFDQSPIGAAIVSLNYHFLRVNNELCRITGYSEEELLSLTFGDITLPEDLEDNIKQAELLKSGKIDQYQMDKRYIRGDGEVIWVRISVRMVKDVSGNPLYFLPMIENINERKQMENEIKASLKEKETLLREIHHRVKNNMQIINSLLSLQAGYIKDEESIELFRDTQNRIKSMAMIHEKLYQSKSLARINFADYIQSLIFEILSSYKIDSDRIKIDVDVKNLFLNIETAIPLALITNELITNSLKHAFPLTDHFKKIDKEFISSDGKGEIKIMTKLCNEKIMLVISDNGIGFPSDMDFKNTDTLGLQLVNNLTEQLDGKIELERNNGTTFKIIFPQIEKTEI